MTEKTKWYSVDGRYQYQIKYVEENGIWKIFCPEHPRNSYSDNPLKTHLFSSGQICVAEGREPRSLEVAEAIAHYWMRGYTTYIQTGEFPDKGGRVSVQD